MNTRISAIATSVYVLVTVMPRYSRSILSSILQGNPRSGGTGAGTYTENGTQYPGLVYSEVNTSLAIDASGISGAVSLPKIKTGTSLFQLVTRAGKLARSALVLSDATVAVVCRFRHHDGECEWKPRDNVAATPCQLTNPAIVSLG